MSGHAGGRGAAQIVQRPAWDLIGEGSSVGRRDVRWAERSAARFHDFGSRRRFACEKPETGVAPVLVKTTVSLTRGIEWSTSMAASESGTS